MKQKAILISLMLLLTAAGITAQNTSDSLKAKQSERWPSFLDSNQRPDGSLYLPTPADTLSRQFVADIIAYHDAKALRDTPRGEQAIREAKTNVRDIMAGISQALGRSLNADQLPQVEALLNRVITDASGATSRAKKYFNRKRPFLYFQEPTLIPEDEESHHTPSYPSSHASIGWAVALVMAELCTDRQEPLLRWGYDYGESRVIAGYHYKSDVEAGRLAASAVVARLHADEAFQQQLRKAKAELAK